MADTSLFIFELCQVIVYILVYIDDILLTSNDNSVINSFIYRLYSQFALKDLGPLHFFLGFEVIQTSNGLHLAQTKYAKVILLKANMHEYEPCSVLITANTKIFLIDSEPHDHPYCIKA